MQIRLITLKDKGAGGVARQDSILTQPVLKIGRGTDCAIYLPHIALAMHHATLEWDADERPVLRAEAGALILLNDRPTTQAVLKERDVFRLGPYRITVGGSDNAAGIGGDISLTVQEEAQAASTATGALTLEKLWNGRKRAAAWAMAAAIALLFAGVPLFWPSAAEDTAPETNAPLESAWTSGPLSSAHGHLEDDCASCHAGDFSMVQDASCLTCHADTPHHIHTEIFDFAELEETRCGTCHKEHEGGPAPILRADSGCTECHVNIDTQAPKAGLLNVASFTGAGHPEFRYTITQDPENKKAVRKTLAEVKTSGVQEISNLKFPHDKHLVEKGVRGPQGLVQLECASCHERDPGATLFRPVDMEQHCASCHSLQFDQHAPNRLLPHGKPHEIAAIIRDYYASKAVAKAEAALTTDRRRPGHLPPERRQQVIADSRAAADEALTYVFTKGMCASCHIVTPPPEDGADWNVKPVLVRDVWLPKSRFDHQAHNAVACADCHAAAASTASTDILMPDRDSCTTCHGPAKDAPMTFAHAGAIASDCVMCHDFHREGLPPMRPQPAGK